MAEEKICNACVKTKAVVTSEEGKLFWGANCYTNYLNRITNRRRVRGV